MEQDSHQTKAMVEVALALAMGFFSIMILAMISMGAGVGTKTAATRFVPGISVNTSTLYENQGGAAPKSGQLVAATDLIIFYKNRFLDADLNPVDPVAWLVGKAKPVLAVTPKMDFQSVIDTRHKLGAEGVKVTSLNRQWLARLRSLKVHHNLSGSLSE